MSAFTDPSSVPIHSPTTGTSFWTTGTTRTTSGGGDAACLPAQAAAARRAPRTTHKLTRPRISRTETPSKRLMSRRVYHSPGARARRLKTREEVRDVAGEPFGLLDPGEVPAARHRGPPAHAIHSPTRGEALPRRRTGWRRRRPRSVENGAMEITIDFPGPTPRKPLALSRGHPRPGSAGGGPRARPRRVALERQVAVQRPAGEDLRLHRSRRQPARCLEVRHRSPGRG